MPSGEVEQLEKRLVVRTFEPRDQSAVSELYVNGLLAGQIAPNDTGADIDNIDEAYFSEPSSHFWVAEVDKKVLGMIGVAGEQEHTAEIRRLRVQPQWQNSTIGAKLIETALAHCKHYGYLKIVLDTRFDTNAVMSLFERFGFQHNRSKTHHGKVLLEFYLDLYRPEKPEEEGKGLGPRA